LANSRLRKFIIVFFVYLLVLLLAIVLIDNIIFPSIVSDKKTATVPNVQGRSLSEARRLLGNSDLELEVTKEIYSEKSKPGCVVSQKPKANSKVKSGRVVFVTISKGRELVPVPYLIGLQLRSAKINLMKSGFELGEVYYDFSDNIPQDAIISQSKQAGSKIPYGERIDITVSKGGEEQIKIPNLLGMTQSEARVAIDESGLLLGTVYEKVDGTYLPGIVIQQYPSPGETAKSGAYINITITK